MEDSSIISHHPASAIHERKVFIFKSRWDAVIRFRECISARNTFLLSKIQPITLTGWSLLVQICMSSSPPSYFLSFFSHSQHEFTKVWRPSICQAACSIWHSYEGVEVSEEKIQWNTGGYCNHGIILSGVFHLCNITVFIYLSQIGPGEKLLAPRSGGGGCALVLWCFALLFDRSLQTSANIVMLLISFGITVTVTVKTLRIEHLAHVTWAWTPIKDLWNWLQSEFAQCKFATFLGPRLG